MRAPVRCPELEPRDSGNEKSTATPPIKEACRAACSSMSSSSNPSTPSVGLRLDPEAVSDGFWVVERCGTVAEDEERAGSGSVDATSSASVRLSASGACGSVWTIANTEYPVHLYQYNEYKQVRHTTPHPPIQLAAAPFRDITCSPTQGHLEMSSS